jgi:hypothetical protein
MNDGWVTQDDVLLKWWLILSNNKPPHVQSTFCALLALPTRERERERLWNNAKFILGPHVEECSLGLSVNCDLIFWELGVEHGFRLWTLVGNLMEHGF